MLRLAEVFQNGMILQREKPVAVWGTANPEASVTIHIQNQEVMCKASKEGDWMLYISGLSASSRENMTIIAGEDRMELEDVAVGEVFLAAGQSNMEFWMRYEKHFASEQVSCGKKNIRFYDVPKVAYDGQRETFDYSRMGIWRKADASNLEYFSAVGYYFAKELAENMDVPVGIVGCNWGGTNASVWMNCDSAKSVASAWVKNAEGRRPETSWEKYFEQEKDNPMNDTGNPFANAFNEMVLPGTPSRKEISDFFESLPPGEEPDLMRLKPQEIPGCLYNHMVSRIAPFTMRGVLYYQGESDDELGEEQENYDKRLIAIMEDWRKLWGEADLPFFIVQLPGWREWMEICNRNWAAIRLCQQKVAERDLNAYLCCISDVGEEYDIHPKDKKVVGYRLSLLARHYLFGEKILCDAPVLKEARRIGKEIVLKFENAGGGLRVDGEKISAMYISAPVHSVQIEGDEIHICMDNDCEEKVHVDFAMSDWFRVNLYNSAGIPAVPFRISV